MFPSSSLSSWTVTRTIRVNYDYVIANVVTPLPTQFSPSELQLKSTLHDATASTSIRLLLLFALSRGIIFLFVFGLSFLLPYLHSVLLPYDDDTTRSRDKKRGEYTQSQQNCWLNDFVAFHHCEHRVRPLLACMSPRWKYTEFKIGRKGSKGRERWSNASDRSMRRKKARYCAWFDERMTINREKRMFRRRRILVDVGKEKEKKETREGTFTLDETSNDKAQVSKVPVEMRQTDLHRPILILLRPLRRWTYLCRSRKMMK